MRNTFTYISLAAAIMVAACFTACEKVEVSTGDEVPEEIVTPAITMSVNATKVGETKALSDDGSAITSTWTQGDKVEVWTADGTTTKYGTLTAESGGTASTTFTGELNAAPQNGEDLLLKYGSPDYASQDGTLTGNAKSIDKICDYALATVTATVSGTTVITTDADFVSQQAILKLNLKNSDGSVDITSDVRQLTVTLGGQTVTVDRTPAAGPVYVAVPAAEGSIVFYAAKGKYLYTKSVSKTLTAGHLYPVNLSMSIVEGALSGLFSVSASKKVYFSKGNLMADFNSAGNSYTWSFANNQWGCVGDHAANNVITGTGTVSAAGSVDLFGWSATNYNTYGIDSTTDGQHYRGDFRDWGTNAISNGGNTANLWSTMSDTEWDYLKSHATWGMATVAGVCGLIILPDNYSGTAITSGYGNKWNTNSIDDSSWASNYEAYGAVFLPAAGYRTGTTMFYDPSFNAENRRGYYWSSRSYNYGGNYGGYYVLFDITGFYSEYDSQGHIGKSVRLVRVAN